MYMYLNELGQIFRLKIWLSLFYALNIHNFYFLFFLMRNIHNSTIDTMGIGTQKKKSEKYILFKNWYKSKNE